MSNASSLASTRDKQRKLYRVKSGKAAPLDVEFLSEAIPQPHLFRYHEHHNLDPKPVVGGFDIHREPWNTCVVPFVYYPNDEPIWRDIDSNEAGYVYVCTTLRMAEEIALRQLNGLKEHISALDRMHSIAEEELHDTLTYPYHDVRAPLDLDAMMTGNMKCTWLTSETTAGEFWDECMRRRNLAEQSSAGD